MYLKIKRCRCCGENSFQRLKEDVEVDPFFARYGLQVNCQHEAIIPILDWGLKRKIERLPKAARERANNAASRFRKKILLTSQAIRIPYGMCETCNFLAPWFLISDDQLSDYYAHYLTKAYKEARTEFQPGYAMLGAIMGSEEENRVRSKSHTDYLLPFLEDYMAITGQPQISLLDYGGGEGGVQPISDRVCCDIYEISPDHDLSIEEGKKLYDCVQCLHVLEHVGHPRNTCIDALERCKPGGLFFLEVPIEFPGTEAVREGNLPPCHEHINKLSIKAIQQLLLSLKGDILALQEDTVNFLHLDGLTPVIRAVFKKAESNP